METSIVVKGLVKRYKDLMALNHFEIEIQKGELLALLGPNGCGKTTLINCMLGFLTFDSGEITVLGENQFPFVLKLLQSLIVGVVLILDVLVLNHFVFDNFSFEKPHPFEFVT